MDREDLIQLAIRDFNDGKFKYLSQAVRFHRVPQQSTNDRFNGRPTRQEARVSQQILSPTQEQCLKEWTLDQEATGNAPTLAALRAMASAIHRLSGGSGHIRVEWYRRFLKRNLELKVKLG